MNISGIYKIESILKPERIYIGSAVRIDSRWRVHINALKGNKHHSSKLQNHFNKYGEQDLIFSVLLGCNKEDLIKTEQYFMDIHKPYFNECKIAGSVLGTKRSPEIRKKMSDAMKGKKRDHPFTIESRRNMSESHKGLKCSDETKLKLSISQKKVKRGPLPKSTCIKMSISNMGHNVSSETRKKISDTRKGRHFNYTDEHRKKLSESNKGKVPWNKGLKGIYSKEVLKRMSENHCKNRKLKVA